MVTTFLDIFPIEMHAFIYQNIFTKVFVAIITEITENQQKTYQG